MGKCVSKQQQPRPNEQTLPTTHLNNNNYNWNISDDYASISEGSFVFLIGHEVKQILRYITYTDRQIQHTDLYIIIKFEYLNIMMVMIVRMMIAYAFTWLNELQYCLVNWIRIYLKFVELVLIVLWMQMYVAYWKTSRLDSDENALKKVQYSMANYYVCLVWSVAYPMVLLTPHRGVLGSVFDLNRRQFSILFQSSNKYLFIWNHLRCFK